MQENSKIYLYTMWTGLIVGIFLTAYMVSNLIHMTMQEKKFKEQRIVNNSSQVTFSYNASNGQQNNTISFSNTTQTEKTFEQISQLSLEQQVTQLNEENEKQKKEIRENLMKTLPETNIRESIEVVQVEKKEELSLGQKFFNLFKKNPEVQVNDTELDMLAKIIHAEAGAEPYEGKVAVGAVILNRIRSGKFQKTIKDVIFASKQFEPVDNGSYQRAKPNTDDYKAAKEALAGSDPTDGALYFYAPTLTKVRWHETLTYIKTIGGHKFFK